MLAIDYLKKSNLNECYVIHSHFYRDWTIGDYETFDTLEQAKSEGRKRLETNKEIRKVEIHRYYKENGHIYYDGVTTWFLRRE